MARRLAAIMYTDVVGFTASAQANESDALVRLREQEGIVRPLFKPYKGREIKSTGDGFLVEFESALGALECAVEIQRRMRERNSRKPRQPLELRVGVHVGDVEESGGDIFGDAVNVASRIVPLAEPGGVCLSGQVFDHVHDKVVYGLERLSAPPLKGIRGRMDVYRVVLPWAAEDRAEPSSGLPRIAVLPLSNISPDAENEYFADGLTEELITVLSQIKGLRVISRTSVNQYKGTTKAVAQIGSELGADSVLEGSVRRAGDQLRISVQLIDTRTDEHRWAQTYDRKLENVFAIQAEVAERTASALKVELLISEAKAIRERPTSNMEAYEYYLRGIEAFRHYEGWWDQAHDAEARRCFEAAIQLDPAFAAAHSFLANYLLAVMGMSRSYKETVPRARECAARALALNPNLSDAHTARGNLAHQADLNWGLAEVEYQQAIALNPSSSTPRFWYGYLLWALQRYNESEKQYRAAVELDPLWVLPRQNLAWNCAFRGDTSAATAAFQRLAEENPGEASILGDLAVLSAWCGRKDEALRLLAGLKDRPDRVIRVIRANVLAMLGRPQELRALMDDYEAGKLDWYVAAAHAAEGYALLGEDEKALKLLEVDLREGEKLLWAIYQGWGMDRLRDDPRFIALLRAADLPTTLSRPRWSPPVSMAP